MSLVAFEKWVNLSEMVVTLALSYSFSVTSQQQPRCRTAWHPPQHLTVYRLIVLSIKLQLLITIVFNHLES